MQDYNDPNFLLADVKPPSDYEIKEHKKIIRGAILCSIALVILLGTAAWTALGI